ncbi:hypothetical protein MN608_09752 [Microdochium nivale]|nr:hypothetical protein MN608_09752 [Microdochium nivale]
MRPAEKSSNEATGLAAEDQPQLCALSAAPWRKNGCRQGRACRNQADTGQSINLATVVTMHGQVFNVRVAVVERESSVLRLCAGREGGAALFPSPESMFIVAQVLPSPSALPAPA